MREWLDDMQLMRSIEKGEEVAGVVVDGWEQ